MEFFQACGQITRCTIRADPFTHKPNGSASIEFSSLEGVQNALKLDTQLFRGRRPSNAAKVQTSIKKGIRADTRPFAFSRR
jgi:hypothetical protein